MCHLHESVLATDADRGRMHGAGIFLKAQSIQVSLLLKIRRNCGEIRDKDGLLFLHTLCYNVTTSDKTDKTNEN